MPQKNFRTIPDKISLKLRRIEQPAIIVGCFRQYQDAELAKPGFVRIGLPLKVIGQSIEVVPLPSAGKFSDINVNGEEIIRRDLPKETHYNYVEAPNWGDDYNGTHEVALPYERFPRDFIPPRNTTLTFTLVSQKDGLSVYKILVNEVVQKADDRRLFFCLNLLQENAGAVDVYPSDYDFAQYLSTLQVAWEILPPGERERVLARLAGGRPMAPEQRQLIEDRYNFLLTLNPSKILVGTSGMQRYLGGMIRQDLVVFENIEYGNAAYVMYEDWERLSRCSRVDLLSGRFGKNFDRVVHSTGWKSKLTRLIQNRLKI